MKHKVSELEGMLLDAAVALAAGLPFYIDADYGCAVWDESICAIGGPLGGYVPYKPGTVWAVGGPIIDSERISLTERTTHWVADMRGISPVAGPTALIAAMRAYVASKFGEEVELP